MVQSRNDYRTLQPDLITDPNGNRSQSSFDEFGWFVGIAIMGKETENLGDSLEGFSMTLTSDELTQFSGNSKSSITTALLANATTRFIYNDSRYWLEPDLDKKQPAFNASISRGHIIWILSVHR